MAEPVEQAGGTPAGAAPEPVPTGSKGAAAGLIVVMVILSVLLCPIAPGAWIWLASQLEQSSQFRSNVGITELTGKETRVVVLGHLQRGGPPTTFDRVLGTRFGAAAARLIRKGAFGRMVALIPPDVESLPIREAIGRRKTVPIDNDIIESAREIGICFGD